MPILSQDWLAISKCCPAASIVLGPTMRCLKNFILGCLFIHGKKEALDDQARTQYGIHCANVRAARDSAKPSFILLEWNTMK
jgi:hypothetical protein